MQRYSLSVMAAFLAALLLGGQSPQVGLHAMLTGGAIVEAAEAAPGATIGARGAEMEAMKRKTASFTLTVCAGGCVNAQKNGVPSGGKDVLPALQQLIDRTSSRGGGIVYLPAGVYGIKGTLQLRSGVTLVGAGSGTELRQLAGNRELVRIANAAHVIVANLTIDQSRVVHTSGQSNHGVMIAGASRIGLKGLHIRGPAHHNGNQRGDGIYIRKNWDKGTHWSHFIVIQDTIVEGASRNGIAMVSGENVWMQNVKLRGFSGKPNAAIDLEPEAGDRVRMVTIDGAEVAGKSINLYTHKGIVEDVLIREAQLPSDAFHLEGNVERVLIESSGAAGLVMVSGAADIGQPRAVTVRRSVFRNASAPQAVYLAGESVTFEECEFVGGTNAAVRDAGTTARITVKDSVIRGSKGNGIIIHKARRAELSGNRIYDNAGDGVLLGNSASTVENAAVTGDNQIYRNGRDGIRIDLPRAEVVISGATLYGNGANGLFISNCLSAVVTGNKLRDNDKGILVSDYDKNRRIAGVSIRDNAITNPEGVQRFGIEIVKGQGELKDVQVIRNVITDSRVENLRISRATPLSQLKVTDNDMK